MRMLSRHIYQENERAEEFLSTNQKEKNQIILDVEEALEMNDFEQAKRDDTIESHEKYIHNYPDGKYVQKAKARLKKVF